MKSTHVQNKATLKILDTRIVDYAEYIIQYPSRDTIQMKLNKCRSETKNKTYVLEQQHLFDLVFQTSA